MSRIGSSLRDARSAGAQGCQRYHRGLAIFRAVAAPDVCPYRERNGKFKKFGASFSRGRLQDGRRAGSWPLPDYAPQVHKVRPKTGARNETV